MGCTPPTRSGPPRAGASVSSRMKGRASPRNRPAGFDQRVHRFAATHAAHGTASCPGSGAAGRATPAHPGTRRRTPRRTRSRRGRPPMIRTRQARWLSDRVTPPGSGAPPDIRCLLTAFWKCGSGMSPPHLRSRDGGWGLPCERPTLPLARARQGSGGALLRGGPGLPSTLAKDLLCYSRGLRQLSLRAGDDGLGLADRGLVTPVAAGRSPFRFDRAHRGGCRCGGPGGLSCSVARPLFERAVLDAFSPRC
jgi:hypothetical protein